MDKKEKNLTQRDSLINKLAENIVGSVKDITKVSDSEGDYPDCLKEVKERLSFESSVLLNEMVTKVSPRVQSDEEKKEERKFERFGKNFRSQHMLMFVSVIILIITGMPLKFPEYAISKFVIVDMLGGLQYSTLIHRIGAVGLIIVGVWHVIYIMFSRVGRRDFFLMIPKPQDGIDAFHTIMYYIGKRTSGPKFGRFSFIEKFDYWAVYWGMVVMIGSGIIMWYKEWFPKYVFDIGREAHSDEGLLATLAIVVWHFYNVHFNPEVFPMSWIWWHGQLTESEMKHHHPLEYEAIIQKETKALETESESDSSEEASK